MHAVDDGMKEDILERARIEVEEAEALDDEARLKALVSITEWLENELDQAAPPGR